MKLKNIWRLADISGSYSVAKDIWNDFTPEGVAKLLESKENRLDRAAFLRDCLGPYYPAEQVEKAIAFSPAKAEIPPDVIDRLADICIRRETKKRPYGRLRQGFPEVLPPSLRQSMMPASSTVTSFWLCKNCCTFTVGRRLKKAAAVWMRKSKIKSDYFTASCAEINWQARQ